MSLAAKAIDDIRSRASFMPYCHQCSFLSHAELGADLLRGPSLRRFRDKVKVLWCCQISFTEQTFDSEADAAAWWREKRQEVLPSASAEARRKLNLERLSSKGYEPITE